MRFMVVTAILLTNINFLFHRLWCFLYLQLMHVHVIVFYYVSFILYGDRLCLGYTAKCATFDNHMVLDSFANNMITIWYLTYDNNMITIWFSYVHFGLKTYDNRAIIICKLKHMIFIWCSIYMIIIWCKPYDPYVWHIYLDFVVSYFWRFCVLCRY